MSNTPGAEPGLREDGVTRLLRQLVTRSGFPSELIDRSRLGTVLIQRAAELRLNTIEEAASRSLDDPAEYARVEAHFSPPETWLFRYPESIEYLRAFASARKGGGVRALLAGAGGWGEPCSIAAALADGVGIDRLSVRAFDRNPDVFGKPPCFADLALRGGLPEFATRWFEPVPGGLRPVSALIARISVEVGKIEEIAASCAGMTFDVIVCRNVAIYQSPTMRDATFRSLAALLAVGGVMLVGHAELSAATLATTLVPVGEPAAFALTHRSTLHDVTRAASLERPRAAELAPRAAELAPRAAELAPRAAELAPRAAELAPRAAELAPRAAELAPRAADFTPSRPNSAQTTDHLAEAERFEREGRFADALASVRRALYLDPTSEAALLVAARLSGKLGDDAGATRFRERALRAHLARMGGNDAP